MAKVKINILAKAFELTGKEMISMLLELGIEKKSTTSSLEENEMDVFFDYITKKYDDGSPIIFEQTADEEPIIEETIPVVDTIPEIEEKKEEKVSRHIDTRANAVDLEKFEEESRLQDILPEMKQTDTKKQKIKKGKQQREKHDSVEKQVKQQKVKEEKIHVLIPDEITVSELAERMKKPATEIIKKLMMHLK